MATEYPTDEQIDTFRTLAGPITELAIALAAEKGRAYQEYPDNERYTILDEGIQFWTAEADDDSVMVSVSTLVTWEELADPESFESIWEAVGVAREEARKAEQMAFQRREYERLKAVFEKEGSHGS